MDIYYLVKVEVFSESLKEIEGYLKGSSANDSCGNHKICRYLLEMFAVEG
jgi:hypothetical protein